MKQGTIAHPTKSAGVATSQPLPIPKEISDGYSIAEDLLWLEEEMGENKDIPDQGELGDEKAINAAKPSGLEKLHALIKQDKSKRRAVRLTAEQTTRAEFEALYGNLMQELEVTPIPKSINNDTSTGKLEKTRMSGRGPQSTKSKAITTSFDTKSHSAPERTRANSTLSKFHKDEEDRVYTGCPDSVEKMKQSSQSFLRFSGETSTTFELDDDVPKNEESALINPLDEDEANKDLSPKFSHLKIK